MLPPVIEEREAFPFKFWFNNRVQDGMYYRNELFYRLHAVALEYRSRLYHYACKLALRDTVLVTTTDQHCSIWVSLRSDKAATSALRNQPLPSHIVPLDRQPEQSQSSETVEPDIIEADEA